MKTKRTVLVPLDGSNTAQGVFPFISHAAKHEGYEVHLLSVVSSEAKGKAQTYLSNVKSTLESAGIPTKITIRQGYAPEVILDVAFREDPSMIALTDHGESGFFQWSLGNVTEKVVRAARVPVMIRRPQKDRSYAQVQELLTRQASLSNILAPLDGSENSEKILPHLRHFAKRYGAKITLLGVQEIRTGVIVTEDPSDYLKKKAEMLTSGGIEVQAVTRKGDPRDEIVDHASEGNFDLLTMGTHGRSSLERWLLGSVSEKVMRGVEIPVFIVRSFKSMDR